MIINKSSWHYRLLKAADMNIPNSLCPYFWKLVFTIGMSVAVVVMLTVTFLALGLPLIGLGSIAPAAVLWWQWIAAFFAGGVVISGVIALVGFCVFKYVEYDTARDEAKAHKEYLIRIGELPEPKKNVLVEFVKATKTKVCPIIEFK